MTNTVNDMYCLLEEAIACANRYKKVVSQELALVGLTLGESEILEALNKHTAQTHLSLTGLAERIGVQTPPSRLVKGLRMRDLIAESRDKSDQRVWRFRLTAKGKKLAQKATKIRKGLAAKSRSNFRRPSATSVASALRAINWD